METTPAATNLGEILCSEQFPVLKQVLSFLNAKTLCMVAQVCTLWSRTVKRVLKQRGFWKCQLFQDLNEDEENTYIDELPLVPSTVVRLYSHYELRISAPKNCSLVSAKVAGTIGVEGNSKFSTEYLDDGNTILSMNSFSDGVKCTPFVVTDLDFKLIRKNKLSFFTSVNFDLTHCKKMVVFLLLSGKPVKELVKSIKKETPNQHVVIIGGRCAETAHNNKQGVLSGFIIHGEMIEPYLKIYQGYSEQELKNVLSVLKKESVQKSQEKCQESFMLMVSCVGRGPNYYEKNNAECDVISQVFPSVPVFGFFGLGEIAYNSLDELSNDCYEYAYTSVFCLINSR